MKKFSIRESGTKESIEIFLKDKYETILKNPESKTNSQEDFLLFSDKHIIFTIADGVTIIQDLIDGKDYLNPSPAGTVANIFCKEIVKAFKR